jgi:ATP-dependent DNA ligase
MLARTVSSLPTGSGWAFEPKFDGYRVLAFRSRARVELQSRQQRILTAHFPDVAAAIAGLGDEVVLDGELVIWNAGRFDFAALQDRLRSGPRRAHTLAAATPAAYVVFDLLAHGRTDLREQPYQHRRDALEALLGRGLPPGLVLTPSTTDPAVARSWLIHHGPTGIEGVVAKRLDQTYRPGVRGWQKLRTRLTAEAVVGGVIGPLDAPRVLLLGRHDHAGQFHLVGRTTELAPAGRGAVAALLHPHTGSAHPWPNPLPSTRWGRPGPPTLYTPVRPGVVVELTVDTAIEHHRWRHPAHFVRTRPDLRIDDLTPLPGSAAAGPSGTAAAG